MTKENSAGALGITSRMQEEWPIWEARLRVLGDNLKTPCYLYSSQMLRARVGAISEAFEGFEVLVSVKANPNPDVTKALGSDVALDLASSAEIDLALSVGAPLSRCSLVGPGKSRDCIERALRVGIGCIVIESERQLLQLMQECNSRGKVEERPRLLIRINPRQSTGNANERMGGIPSQFGVDEERLPGLLDLALRGGVHVDGFHFFLGSQLTTVEAQRENLAAISSCLQRIGWENTSPLHLNCGGGFGIAQKWDDVDLSITVIAQEYKAMVQELRTSLDCEVVPQIECGRWIFGPAGVFLTRIIDTKVSHGNRFVILESGISGFGRPAFLWGEQHPIWIVGKEPCEGEPYAVTGPTCLPGDLLSTETRLIDPMVGDVVAVGRAGAYGRSMSPIEWGSVQPPMEVVLEDHQSSD